VTIRRVTPWATRQESTHDAVSQSSHTGNLSRNIVLVQPTWQFSSSSSSTMSTIWCVSFCSFMTDGWMGGRNKQSINESIIASVCFDPSTRFGTCEICDFHREAMGLLWINHQHVHFACLRQKLDKEGTARSTHVLNGPVGKQLLVAVKHASYLSMQASSLYHFQV
jgi:hypothetical protein